MIDKFGKSFAIGDYVRYYFAFDDYLVSPVLKVYEIERYNITSVDAVMVHHKRWGNLWRKPCEVEMLTAEEVTLWLFENQ